MPDLKLSIALAAIDTATAPLRRVREAARQMGGGARTAAQRLGSLERSAEQLAAFRKVRANAWQNTRALADLEEQLTGAREKLARVTKETGGTGRAFQRATQHVAFLEKKEAGLIKRTQGIQTAMSRAGDALREAGVDTGHAAAETRRLSADIARAIRRANGLARIEGHFDRIRHAAGGAALAAGALTGRLSRLSGALGLGGLLGGGAAVGGLGSMMQGFAESGREIDQWAGRIGVSTTALQALTAVGGRFGIQQDAMIDGLKELSLRADEFAVTGGGESEEAWQRLGLGRDQINAVKGDTEALFELVRSRMENIQDVSERQRIADELFGGTAAEQMVEMLSASTDELRRMRAEAEANGQILSEEEIAQARTLSDSLRHLSGIMGGLAKTISAKLAPVLTPLLQQLGDWIGANRELIASEISSIVQRLSDALDRVDWSAVLASLKAFGSRVQSVVEAIGGWDTAMIAVVATLNAGLIGSLASLGVQLGRLGAALLANPITAVIAAIAFGAYAIYANWDKIGVWFQAKLDKVRAAFDVGLGSGLWEIIKQTSPWSLVRDAFNGLFKWLFGVDLSALGRQWFGPLLDAIDAVDREITAWIAWIDQKLQPVVGMMRSAGSMLGFGGDDDEEDAAAAPPADTPSRPSLSLPSRFADREPYAGGRPPPANDDRPRFNVVDTSAGVAAAAAANAPNVDSHDTVNLTVNVPPGSDPEEIKRILAELLDDREASRASAARAHLYDGVR
ncbi:hypothetical protein [Rhodospira trueperi]|uniref:Phage tail tape measure protein, TP901 family, core region n=1 Tax=Rhodospira trueperi TaxID=69960 RepID=A0A1G7D2X9_9PROT|nr:hypothetical protein [Rhodospira trueperi]SDE45843.1 phage tail tape measure protein, TP901 family, core region [Rhodospira trueperi]